MKSINAFNRTLLFCLLIAVTVPHHLQGQSTSEKYQLLLKSGIFTPEDSRDIDRVGGRISAAVIGNHADDYFNNRSYKIIQFYRIPNSEDRKKLTQSGVNILDYLPSYAYFVSFPKDYDPTVLADFNVRAILDINPNFKIDPALKEQPYPEWALTKEGKIDIVMQYFKDLEEGMVIEALNNSQIEILTSMEYVDALIIRIDISEIANVAALPFVMYIEPIPSPSVPDDTKGRSLHRSNVIDSDHASGVHYDGTGVSLALGDDGIIGPHIDYKGRIDQTNATINSGNHGDMTSGIMMGAGNINPKMRGMATGAYLYVYSIGGYEHITDCPTTHITNGVMITSTSYSQSCGGNYTTDARNGDKMIRENPSLIHVFSAGNSGASDCGYGAGSGWGNITGGYKAAKNTIATGNLNPFGVLDNSSSRGPADDGRIKPDICANGKDQMSTDGPNAYQVGGGTSAAAPGIAGILAQLYHAYRDMNGSVNPESPLLKACLLNSARDLGNPGPDYTYGWGRVNALRAFRILQYTQFLKDSVDQDDSLSHLIVVPAGTKQLRVMVYWLDYEGTTVATKALVNDLNMKLISPTLTEYDPWVLDPTPNPTNLDADATRGIDDLNNMEQVTLDDPTAGVYIVKVKGFLVPQGPQHYYVVYDLVKDEIEVTYPSGGEPFVPGESETIRWDAFGNTGTFALDYSVDGGLSWHSIDTSVSGSFRYYNWFVPDSATGMARVRITRALVTGISDTFFSILSVPPNLNVVYSCPDTVLFSWDPVPGATGYEISKLGTKYMDSVGVSTDTFFKIPGMNPNLNYWLSVKALGPDNAIGRRANAYYKIAGTWSCPIPVDATLSKIISPGGGTFMTCQDYSNLVVSVQLENFGLDTLYNIPVNYQINGGSIITDTAVGTFLPGSSTTFDFTATVDLSTIGVYNFLSWVTYPADGNMYNDSSDTRVKVITGTLETVIYSEDFETFIACPQTIDCGVTICGLNNGWVNETNGVIDDIDWRTDAGGTPSNNTGPSQDHKPGSSTGKYLYLESSNCAGMVAKMITPCIDLSSMPSPKMSFWYHMSGAYMGQLHIDALSDGEWTEDIISPISGNQGDIWRNKVADLTPFSNKTINIRFRGITGADYRSDMAIDDIFIFESTAPPITDFRANNRSTCIGADVLFTDISLNTPTAWQWSFSPTTVNFIYGSTATTQNPSVVFTATGTYDVTLIATNANGNDTLVQSAYIVVNVPDTIPFREDFENPSFPPVGWIIDDQGGAVTWSKVTVTGSKGFNTTAAYADNFDIDNRNDEDGMITQIFDLSKANKALLTFDVAYAPYNGTWSDDLRIDISIDCGATYVPTGYNKTGSGLATTSNQNTAFTPTSESQWDEHSWDISSYVGNYVILKFVNINNWANNLYIDNINVEDTSTVGIDGRNFGSGLAEILIYPNPGNGLFKLAMKNIEGTSLNMSVVDIIGREIFQQKITNINEEYFGLIDLSEFPDGIYCLYLTTKDGIYKVKIGKQ